MGRTNLILLSFLFIFATNQSGNTEITKTIEVLFNDLSKDTTAQSLAIVSAAQETPPSTEKKKSTLDSLKSLLELAEKKRTAWALGISANFKTDNAGDNRVTDLGTGASVEKGTYPRQFRFDAKSNVRFKKNKLEEEVTTFLLNYDYYVSPNVEAYAFIERFKNSYLGINQRYEIGFGAKLEKRLGKFKNELSKNIDSLFGVYKSQVNKNQVILDTFLNNPNHRELEEYKELEMTSLRRDQTRLIIGIAFSLFYELEKADELVANNNADTLTLESENRYRFVIRPSLELKASKSLTFYGHCYAKFPLFAPYNSKTNPHGDYRIDAILNAKLNLSNNLEGNEKVALLVSYSHRFDNDPPSISYNNVLHMHENRHETVTLGISVKIE